MKKHPLAGPLRLLRLGLHLLVAALLAVVAVRALSGTAGHFAAVLAGSVALAAIYAAGSALARARSASAAWLVVLIAAWLVLLGLTPDAVWLDSPGISTRSPRRPFSGR